MSPFYAIRRGIQVCVVAIFVACGFLLYQQRAALDPVWVLWDAYRNKGSEELKTEIATGKVTQVVDPLTVSLQFEHGRYYNLRLAGLVFPPRPQRSDPAYDQFEKQARERLATIVSGRAAEIQLLHAYDAQRGLGVLFVETTNVNALVLRQGNAKLKREYIKGLPVREQYDFMRAEQLARKERLGLWNRESVGKDEPRTPELQ